MYDSWASRIHLFIKGKKHGRMMLDSIYNGLLVYPTVKENGQTRPKKYSELTEAQQLQDDCDVQATNIILHGLPPDVLYNLFDKFAHVPGETLYEYYWRFSQLINDMHTIRMTMQQVQVNTKFLNALPSEWSKFVTDVKLAKSLYTTNYDQFYAYLSQHERHANEVRVNRERYSDSLAFVANSLTLYNPISVAITFNLVVPMFQQGEDPIKCINKAMAFLAGVASRFPPSNNQLKTLSNPRNQETIQDGRFIVQQVQGRKNQSYDGTGNRGIATTSKGNVAVGPSRVVKCYNCQGEWHMTRQCTQPKRLRNTVWFKEKLMLAEAQEAGQILDEEQLAFLADPSISEALVAHQTIPPNSAFQTDDLNAYDSDYDDDVQEMQYSEQINVDDFEDNEIHSGSNIISYSQYMQEIQYAIIQDTTPSTPNDLLVLSLVKQMTDHVAHLDKENQTNKMVNESLAAELERYKERILIFEQRLNVYLNQREKLIDSQMDDLIRDRNAKHAAFQQEIDTLKETLSNNVKENESLSKH
ncbi:hypothetical protein Tco_1351239 [Tanacetum coccineum]